MFAHWVDRQGFYRITDVPAPGPIEPIDQGMRVIIFGEMAWSIPRPWERFHDVQTRTMLYLDEQTLSRDLEVRKAMSALDVTFVSPIDTFCDRRGCLLLADTQNPVFQMEST
jgi:hypothetical protein